MFGHGINDPTRLGHRLRAARNLARPPLRRPSARLVIHLFDTGPAGRRAGVR
ncbi:hypothetical protein [Streptomyces sp. SAJ15]|uniref:hypothetical protein n=1 Tax=Streptomyces sp. SAJ15 TaxID=2011095 RepID=UPI0016428651|nr:hypothetical protein [Streptomyces sp. SAJ15]